MFQSSDSSTMFRLANAWTRLCRLLLLLLPRKGNQFQFSVSFGCFQALHAYINWLETDAKLFYLHDSYAFPLLPDVRSYKQGLIQWVTAYFACSLLAVRGNNSSIMLSSPKTDILSRYFALRCLLLVSCFLHSLSFVYLRSGLEFLFDKCEKVNAAYAAL